jgi:hypothetical protein
MTTPATPTDPTPAGDDRNFVAVDETYVAPSFEDQLHVFWKKNGKIVIGVCVAILLGIVAKGGWDYVEAQKEEGIRQEYAAATTPEKLKAFAAAHSGHTLAGIAQLRIADDAFTAGKTAEAVAGYEAAIATLKTGPLAARAQLGLAISKILSGKTSEGEAALKALASDAGQLKGVRAEACYHLASLAVDASKPDDVRKFADQLMQIDPSSPWAQRAMMLRAKTVTAAPVVQVGAPPPKP